MQDKYTLYIDTHSEKIVIILYKNNLILSKKEKIGQEHSSEVMPLIKTLFQENNLKITCVNEILVINGPGSFTGVRIGVVLAKVLAYTQNIPIKTLTYLEVMSLNYQEKVTLGIKDKNGIFIGTFNGPGNLINDYTYLKNTVINEEIITQEIIDYEQVYKYALNKKPTSAHLVNPIYVKKINVGGVLK